MKSMLLALVAFYLILVGHSAIAHHSFAATFDSQETISVEGIVTEFRFRNPHVLIYLDATDENGNTTNWMAEGSAASVWRQSGWQNDSLEPGDMMRITGNATHDGSPMVSIKEMHMLNSSSGQVLAELNEDENPEVSLGNITESEGATQVTFLSATLESGEPNFTGTASRIPSQRGAPDINDPAVPYNAVGEAANSSEAWSTENDPQIFCDMPGLFRQAAFTPHGLTINQYPDHVTITYEEYGSRRAIFFGDELPQPGPPSRLGDSVARYDNGNLVIETVNLLPNLLGFRGKPLSSDHRVVEVYSREDNPELGTMLTVETTVYDPTYLTESWTISRTKVYTPGYEFIENECEPPLRERPANVWPSIEWPE